MTLSLSPPIRPSVIKEFFFSLESYNGVSTKSKGVSMKYAGNFIQLSWIGSLRVFKKVLGVFQGCFEGVSE